MAAEVQAAGAPRSAKQSRIGKRPVPVPKGVTVNIGDKKVEVQGPKGKLSVELPPNVKVVKDGDLMRVSCSAAGRDGLRLQGLGRALLASIVKGAIDGFERHLELVGTGYRCEQKGRNLHFALGFSHPVVFELPLEVSATIPPDSKGTILILSSANRSVLGQTAATIRDFRPPEPYAGKGVRYRDEFIRRKAGKAGKAKAGAK